MHPALRHLLLYLDETKAVIRRHEGRRRTDFNADLDDPFDRLTLLY